MARSPNFDVKGIDFLIFPPNELGEGDWEDIQSLHRLSFGHDFESVVNEEGLDWFSRVDDPDYFRDSRLDPRVAVRRNELYRGNFQKPMVVMARSREGLIGYTYSADNTSGNNPLERYLKMHVPAGLNIPKFGNKRYAWQREIVVHPEARGRGLAHVMGYFALSERDPNQPAAAYVWPELLPKASRILQENLGFVATGSSIVSPFRATGPRVEQTRLVARVGDAMANIRKTPGANREIFHATQRLHP